MPADYFRRDRKDGITAPDLRKNCSFSDHIVRARGKRTNFTSVSLDAARLEDFGDQTYRLNRALAEQEDHGFVEHNALLEHLRAQAREGEKEERLKAIRALTYARRRLEGLVEWHFDISGVDPKDTISWAYGKVQKFFGKC